MLWTWLKGKFSSDREGALASKFNYDFKLKQLSEVMLFNLFLKVFYVYLSKMYTETAELSKKEDCEFCTWATYKITVKFELQSNC